LLITRGGKAAEDTGQNTRTNSHQAVPWYNTEQKLRGRQPTFSTSREDLPVLGGRIDQANESRGRGRSPKLRRFPQVTKRILLFLPTEKTGSFARSARIPTGSPNHGRPARWPPGPAREEQPIVDAWTEAAAARRLPPHLFPSHLLTRTWSNGDG